MRIGIDGRLIVDELSGIPTYIVELLTHLVQEDRQNEYVVFFSNQNLEKRFSEQTGINSQDNFSTATINYKAFSIKNQLFMGHLIKKHNLDIFHSPDFMIPFLPFPKNKRGSTACLINIHDLIPMTVRDYAPRSKKTRFYPVYKGLLREAVARTDKILTHSLSAKNDIIQLLNVEPDKIALIPHGVNKRFTPIKREDKTTKRIFWVGRRDPYKNLMSLIEAFDILLKKTDCSVELRLAGPADDRYPEYEIRAHELGIADKIITLGYLTNEQLVDEYRNADVFVFPTLYEGFGLVILESMACGTPVVCGDIASVPEVAGDAASIVDVKDPEQIAHAVHEILTNKELASELSNKGLAVSQKFTWAHAAKETVKLYEQL
ncbi:MAG: glycosyltransferase family 4 protein [Lentisphaerae bacterium]|nr:glycosyltransferase family 4 protein [Lentisphaerota bacterium]